jgi:TPR repeat protein
MFQSKADFLRVGSRVYFGLVVLILLCLFIFASARPSFCQTHQSVAANNNHDEIKTLQSAAEKGDARSQCLLGMSFLMGKGVPKDYPKGVKWLQKAADQGVMQAQNMLGLMYRDGEGVPKDYIKAGEYFQKAAAQGDEIAQQHLEDLHTGGKLGNFSRFKEDIAKTGLFTPDKVLNGFSIFQNKEDKLNLLAMRSCDGYCCEGFIAIQPMEVDDLDGYIGFLYGPLQNTLYLTKKESVENGFKERVSVLRSQIMANLKQSTSNRTEFAFDHLNVRGECPPVSDAEFKAGKRPVLTIKLWIP